MELESRVAQHYGHGSLEGAILAALTASGKDPDRLTPADLAPVDEFHIGGREATVAFAQNFDAAPGLRLLDVGSGLGGASRYFASEQGCDVTGVDLTEEFVRVAEALARRVGLQAQVRYRQASALGLPFEDGAFDGVYMLHVGMNIADKAALFSECRRVLKPGGRLGVYDVMREGDGELPFPMPWAADPQTSFVETAESYGTAMRRAGFDVAPPLSRRDFGLAFFERMREAAAKNAGKPPPLGLHILMGAATRDKVANMIDALQRGLISPTEILGRAV